VLLGVTPPFTGVKHTWGAPPRALGIPRQFTGAKHKSVERLITPGKTSRFYELSTGLHTLLSETEPGRRIFEDFARAWNWQLGCSSCSRAPPPNNERSVRGTPS
jgi:hypothetical protein